MDPPPAMEFNLKKTLLLNVFFLWGDQDYISFIKNNLMGLVLVVILGGNILLLVQAIWNGTE